MTPLDSPWGWVSIYTHHSKQHRCAPARTRGLFQTQTLAWPQLHSCSFYSFYMPTEPHWVRTRQREVWESSPCDTHTPLIKNYNPSQCYSACACTKSNFPTNVLEWGKKKSISPTKQPSPNYLFLLWVSSLYLSQETHWKLATAGSLVYGQLKKEDIETIHGKQEK